MFINDVGVSSGMLLALLRRYVRPYRRLVSVLMLLQVISTLATLYLPTVNAAIIDDGVARGDTTTIVRLGGVMLLVTALQVICAIGAVYLGSRAGLSVGRDIRAAMFSHVTSFSEHESARFGAATLLTRTTNDVQQMQMLVQMTFTVLVTAPIMWPSTRTPAWRGCCWSVSRCWDWATGGSSATCCRSSAACRTSSTASTG